jgi:hypothetical protein
VQLHIKLVLGLFVDRGGKDNYLLVPEKYNQSKLEEVNLAPKNLITNPVAGNNLVWCRLSIPHDVKRAYGCGIDAL